MSVTVIIGGGPAGIMAAGTAASGGGVYLIEKNAKLGRKLAITGKGRCNITNACPVPDLIKNVITNPSFLYSAFNKFTNEMLINFIEELGVKTKVERGGRVFPQSDRAADVIGALEKYLKQRNVKIMGETAKSIVTENGAVKGVLLGGGRIISADNVILATGGKSYPITGSTGDGYKIAAKLGHTITPLKPSLVPVVCSNHWVKNAMGLSLRNIGFKILDDSGKEIYRDFGELLFTHFGISGPVVLSGSSHLDAAKHYKAFIDLKPALSNDELDKRLIKDFEKFSKKDFVNSLDDLLPQKLISVIIMLSGIDARKKTGSISRIERQNLVELLKNLALDVVGLRPVEEAVITSGGIKTSEINPKTMESKLVSGLYFAGEIIDVDAYTGGFNLQIAFSTGYLAGSSIARY